MEKHEIEEILHRAKKYFLDNDKYLLTATANERAITHKFAEYLQNILGCAWNVDCEYNRYGIDGKKIVEEIVDIVGVRVSTSETKACTVYPDIIIHKRGLKDQNLVVIEAKKDATKASRAADESKLKKIKKTYSYIYAVFLNFKTGDAQDIEIEFIF